MTFPVKKNGLFGTRYTTAVLATALVCYPALAQSPVPQRWAEFADAGQLARLQALSPRERAAIDDCIDSKLSQQRQGGPGSQYVYNPRACLDAALKSPDAVVKEFYLDRGGLSGRSTTAPLCPDCAIQLVFYCRQGVSRPADLRGKTVIPQTLGASPLINDAIARLGAQVSGFPLSGALGELAGGRADCVALLELPESKVASAPSGAQSSTQEQQAAPRLSPLDERMATIARAQKETAQEQIAQIRGTWEGTYRCGSNLIVGVVVAITGDDPKQLESRLDFFPVQQRPDVPIGAFILRGSYYVNTSTIPPSIDRIVDLRPAEWVTQPPNSKWSRISGKLLNDGLELSFVEFSDCQRFKLTRITGPSRLMAEGEQIAKTHAEQTARRQAEELALKTAEAKARAEQEAERARKLADERARQQAEERRRQQEQQNRLSVCKQTAPGASPDEWTLTALDRDQIEQCKRDSIEEQIRAKKEIEHFAREKANFYCEGMLSNTTSVNDSRVNGIRGYKLCTGCNLRVEFYCRSCVADVAEFSGKKIGYETSAYASILKSRIESVGASPVPFDGRALDYAFDTKRVECMAFVRLPYAPPASEPKPAISTAPHSIKSPEDVSVFGIKVTDTPRALFDRFLAAGYRGTGWSRNGLNQECQYAQGGIGASQGRELPPDGEQNFRLILQQRLDFHAEIGKSAPDGRPDCSVDYRGEIMESVHCTWLNLNSPSPQALIEEFSKKFGTPNYIDDRRPRAVARWFCGGDPGDKLTLGGKECGIALEGGYSDYAGLDFTRNTENEYKRLLQERLRLQQSCR